jgi:hypothetical protein
METFTIHSDQQRWAGGVHVCTDCYFAHHFGAYQDETGRWFTTDTVTPCDAEPLAWLDGFELFDDTDSDSGDGIDPFSSSRCEGCHSTLGGTRFRLHAIEAER